MIMMNTRNCIVLFTLITLFFTSCEEKTQIADMTLSAQVDGLPPIDGSDIHYYMYLQNGDVYTYVTEVIPAADSTWSIEEVTVDPIRLADAKQILVVVSGSDNAPETPDGSTLLAADFRGIETTLSIGHSEAIGDPFGTQSGEYYLYTPTLVDTLTWYTGMWTYDTTTLDTASLVLPEINEDWVYEGWVQVQELDTFLSIGRWRLNNEADSGNPFSSDEVMPFGFPGEDFIQNLPSGLAAPLDLRGREFMITLEPVNDPELDKPFHLIVLTEQSLGGVNPQFRLANGNLKSYELIPRRDFPGGTARR